MIRRFVGVFGQSMLFGCAVGVLCCGWLSLPLEVVICFCLGLAAYSSIYQTYPMFLKRLGVFQTWFEWIEYPLWTLKVVRSPLVVVVGFTAGLLLLHPIWAHGLSLSSTMPLLFFLLGLAIPHSSPGYSGFQPLSKQVVVVYRIERPGLSDTQSQTKEWLTFADQCLTPHTDLQWISFGEAKAATIFPAGAPPCRRFVFALEEWRADPHTGMSSKTILTTNHVDEFLTAKELAAYFTSFIRSDL